ncbi:pilus assembly protein [Erwinia sp. OLTSP20]|uniref:fimbria/pilus periplasmic chaperone n=1 Tax=unclassified Erwinia TaxID=2622719 RepID=UPI000C198EC8|nr:MULTISPECIES: fimbria/pilus periplasmic chaperone [unclassified Erwinia]PIJ49610.1 pilus assembly protein [Erwinia sp. OAMSP11]PIJ71606.1 pilus assembly protein [Erwinia sp. OLSSP12]PIJ82676.1 pilus assembly protein [Erwinia sp. OLCASP19]PIJ83143.1 pilus assembly protein [Erwinia sp. OLMTSP26]PIJ85309.1 pilus assembly protein [Erwinia sp. OLMDSP33]
MKMRIILFVLAMLTCSFPSIANMTISGTRIIFPANENEVDVRTNNKGSQPALVQVWVDEDKLNSNLNNIKVPFILTPPIYRVEPGKGQSVRLIYNGMNLPQNRESVFWFNMLEIPPKVTEHVSQQRLDLAFRTRIKIFYRPSSISNSNSSMLKKNLKWQVVNTPKKGTGVKVTNPTPYYFSFDELTVESQGKKTELNVKMVSPFSSAIFYPIKKTISGEKITGIYYGLINDYGAVINSRLTLLPSGIYSEDAKK